MDLNPILEGLSFCYLYVYFNHYLLMSHIDLEGKCYWGSIPISLLSSSLENCVTLSLGHKAEMVSAINMHPSYLEVVT
jgi:hypothetical protein